MIIPIDENWRLTTDPLQWKVEKAGKVRQNGNERWDAVGYYPSFESAVRALADRMVRECSSVGIEEALKDIDDVVNRLSRALPDLSIEIRQEVA